MSSPQMLFVNLPVSNLARARAFYEAVGFTQNKQFSDENTNCMVLSETISVMIMTHARWKTFTTKQIPDARGSAQVMLALTRESRTAVDATVEAGTRAGGKPDPSPAQDHGFMYGRSLEDPDGHVWEYVWMDPAAIAQ